MPKVVNLYEAKSHLSELVERAAAGDEIVIAKAGRPRARLTAIAPTTRRRKPGRWKGKVWIAPDFDDELPAEVLATFEGDGE